MEFQDQVIGGNRLLPDINIKLSYRTGRDRMVEDFYNPCLKVSTMYRRAVGYFTSHGLALAAKGVASLSSRKGKMRLVASPFLNPEDVEVIRSAISDPATVLEKIVVRNMTEIEDSLINDRLNALAWLAATGLLEIKLALRLDSRGEVTRGIYHEKLGIFSDTSENHVSFSGSSNETSGGLLENFESIKAFCSWTDLEGRVQEDIDNFEALWDQDQKTPGLKVIDFSEVGNNLLERFRYPSVQPVGWGLTEEDDTSYRRQRQFDFPDELELRDYQKEAIRAWSEAGGKGIFSMATGSGKTLTALALATKVSQKNSPLVVIIICPYLNLCHQWNHELSKFSIQSISCFGKREDWESKLEEGYQRLKAGLGDVLTIVTTNATFMGNTFKEKLKSRVADSGILHLIIADEVHNLGAKKGIESLPEQIQLRLALSATPNRNYDPIGTEAVLDYFGGVCFEYPMEKAMAEGHLCPYRYYPVLVEMTDEETESYLKLTNQIARLFHGNFDEKKEVSPNIRRLLIKRAKLLANAKNKLSVLHNTLETLTEPPEKAIFYCGEGKTTDEIEEDETRQIQKVARLLGEEHHLRVRSFTFREKPKEREEVLRDFKSGFLDGIVAIRCLDEGIDLPELRMGFLLASSTNPRQFIQRRGRLLRNAPGKERAIIYDFIMQPPDFGGELDDESFNMERNIFKKELKRISEFCKLAENGPEALNQLKPLRGLYNLLST
jgi:DNA phosphorothioation system restriction enzyme